SVKIPESTVVVKQEQAGNAARFVLRNGMTVLLSEQHTEPYAAVAAYFGTKHLTESEYYAGRVLQKALIAGDLQTAPFKNAKAIRSFGGKLTARAGRDYSYFCTLTSSKHVNDVLAAQSEMLIHPALSADGARRATALVDAENRLSCESATDYSLERVAALAASIYQTDSSGSGDTQGAGSQERLSDFYKGYYRPDNLVLSVVGDISTFDTLVQIERLFGDFGSTGRGAESGDKSAPSLMAKPSTSQATGSINPQKASEPSIQRESSNGPPKLLYLENRGTTNQSIVTVGYRTPGLKSDEWAATAV